MLQSGLKIDDINIAISISNFITKNLFQKSGVILPNQEVINIIVDSMQKIKSILPYSIFREKKIKTLSDKGLSQINIEKIESKDKIKNEYEIYYKVKKYSIISSRFLISIQTIIPNVIRSSKFTICPFYSFNNEEGLSYIACLLQEMNIINLYKNKSMNIFKENIENEYNQFKNLFHIKKMFSLKKEYELELSKKTKDYIVENKLNMDNNELIEAKNIENNYNTIISKTKDTNEINRLYHLLLNRLLYLGKLIKKM